MRIKRFRGRSVADAVERIKREWGPDALILQARRVRAARWWRFWRPRWEFEVTAACADGASGDPGTGVHPRAAEPGPSRGPVPPGTPGAPEEVSAAEPPGAGAPPGAPSGGPPCAGSGATPGGSPGAPPGDLEGDVRQMKELVACIWQQLKRVEEATRAGEVAAAPPLYPPGLEPLYRALLEREVEPSLARCLVDLLLDRAEGKGPGLLRQEAAAVVERLLGPARPIQAGGEGRVVALVGPTGVGKTTTLAKLAAHFALREGRRVCLVTVDTFRVGAVDQLRIYADIAGLPCLVARTPEEFAGILGRAAAENELVLVDTAGRSHHDEVRMSELARFWAARRPDEVHLVVSATSRYSDALEVLERYREVGFDRLLFTKLDETRRHGLILNVAVVAQKPLSYVTTGQQVPEDIAVARPGDLAKLLV